MSKRRKYHASDTDLGDNGDSEVDGDDAAESYKTLFSSSRVSQLEILRCTFRDTTLPKQIHAACRALPLQCAG